MLSFLMIAGLFWGHAAGAAAPSAVGSANEKDAVRFEIKALPGLERHLDLLAHPPYAAVASENAAINPEAVRRLRILSSDKLEVLSWNRTLLGFRERRGSIFVYELETEGLLAMSPVSLKMPVEVDISRLKAGKVLVRAYPPLGRLLPNSALRWMRRKLDLWLSPAVQSKILAYLDGLPKQPGKGADASKIELILREGYNRLALVSSRRLASGQAVASPSLYRPLVLTVLAIWVLAFSVMIYLGFRRDRLERLS